MLNSLSLSGLAWQLAVVAIDLGIAIIALSSLRYLQGLMAGVNSTHELSEKDNFAFGVSISGNALALALIMAGVVTGEGLPSLLDEAIHVSSYALLGIVLLKIGTLINDKVIFHTFSLKEQVKAENMAAGTVQAANFIALGIIINASIKWVESDSLIGLLSVIVVFVLAQVLMLAVTRIRSSMYQKKHNGHVWQVALEKGNTALAIRYSGHIISTALAVGAAGGFVGYLQNAIWLSAIYWFGTSLVIMLALVLLSSFAGRIVLAGINCSEEVDKQQNLGVAYIEAAIYVAVALIIYALMS